MRRHFVKQVVLVMKIAPIGHCNTHTLSCASVEVPAAHDGDGAPSASANSAAVALSSMLGIEPDSDTALVPVLGLQLVPVGATCPDSDSKVVAPYPAKENYPLTTHTLEAIIKDQPGGVKALERNYNMRVGQRVQPMPLMKRSLAQLVQSTVHSHLV